MQIVAGGTPVIIPPVADKNVIINTLEHLDGLLLTGGGDYNPLWCGEQPSPRLHTHQRHATCPNCSSPDWPTTVKSRCSASAVASDVGCGSTDTCLDIGARRKSHQTFAGCRPQRAVAFGDDTKNSPCSTVSMAQRISMNSFHHQAVGGGETFPRHSHIARRRDRGHRERQNTSPSWACNGIPNGWAAKG